MPLPCDRFSLSALETAIPVSLPLDATISLSMSIATALSLSIPLATALYFSMAFDTTIYVPTSFATAIYFSIPLNTATHLPTSFATAIYFSTLLDTAISISAVLAISNTIKDCSGSTPNDGYRRIREQLLIRRYPKHLVMVWGQCNIIVASTMMLSSKPVSSVEFGTQLTSGIPRIFHMR
jgi:hypothetical protein